MSEDVATGSWHVALVDDDAAVLRSLSRMLSACGYQVSTFSSADVFLSSLDTGEPEVMLIDLRLPGTDGLALQAIMRQRGLRIPTVFLSGHGDVPTSVRAIQGGAVDFLEKPCDEATLLAALERAVDVAAGDRTRHAALRELTERWLTLTRREREVYCCVVTGRLNKQIASALGTVEKTIKVHRARVMTKMRAASVAELVRIFDLLGHATAESQGSIARRMRGLGSPTYRSSVASNVEG